MTTDAVLTRRSRRVAIAQAVSTRRRRRVLVAVPAAILVVALAVLGAVMLWPQQVERAYGESKVAIDAFLTPGLPNVTLGAVGDTRELDRCDGTFTRMRLYEHVDRPPVWASHNNCGGDVILAWELGDRVQITGAAQDGTYEVVEIRYTRKWAQLEQLNGMGGTLALQTCFYGEDRMKFVALQPVDVPRRWPEVACQTARFGEAQARAAHEEMERRGPPPRPRQDLTSEERMTTIEDAARAATRGIFTAEAATELLIRLGRVIVPRAPWLDVQTTGDGTPRIAVIDADKLLYETGAWSGSEQRVVRIACSLLGDHPVDLAEDLAGLDRVMADTVLAAIAHGMGSHEHSDIVRDHDGKLTGFVALSTLHAWPETAADPTS